MGKQWKQWKTLFIYFGSKITSDGNCSHEIKRCLLLGSKVMTNLESILKIRDITLPAKVCLVKAMVFPVVYIWMWELDYKKKLSTFWTAVLEKTLESSLDCKEVQPVHPKGNQSWICIGRTDAEVEMQILGHLMRRTDSFEKILMLGKIEDRRRRGQQRMKWSDGITDLMDLSLSKLRELGWTGKPGVLQSMGSQSWMWLNWTNR